ncbi:MAG TPA: hypothetical protein VKE40_10690 [Gemmataceae bacterium]|nr:hypothetical protein [Gemmataceae bacterium]
MPNSTILSERADERDPPPVKVSARCPSCGSEEVIVFPVFGAAAGLPPNEWRLVCTECCPRPAVHA